MRPILEVSDLSINFGGIKALDQLSLDINPGEIVALIGPNGAGKTTFFNCITGIYKPTDGNVLLSPADSNTVRLNGLKPNKITEKGMARTFQNIRLFSNMTVLENVMIGRHCRTRAGILGAVLRNKKTQDEERQIIDSSYEILKKVGLAKYANEFAQNLSYGEQRTLEIARALATEPAVLLLDEPAAGMNAKETEALDKLICKIRDTEGIAILLIEHDMSLVMSISDRIFVMEYGRRIAHGTPEEIRNDPTVIKAYLGEE
jgi:branched-chain amino acid transport system ATP-binding protein